MNQHYHSHPFLALLMGGILMLSASAVCAEAIGKVIFSSADVQIQSASGATKLATKGMVLESGDSIQTAAGGIQMRMDDEAIFSLQAHTQFRFDDYHRNPNDSATERSFVRLIKGSLRSVTGLIGKTNHKNYKLTAPTSTIGIRGTAFSMVSNDRGDTVSVSSGGVSMCNSGGCVDVDVGQSAFASSEKIRPIITSGPSAGENALNPSDKNSDISTSSRAIQDSQTLTLPTLETAPPPPSQQSTCTSANC